MSRKKKHRSYPIRQCHADECHADKCHADTDLLYDLRPEPPDNAHLFQTLRVVEDRQHDCKIHVAITGKWAFAKSWGSYLAQVAEIIARGYTHLHGGLDDIRDGFNEHFKKEASGLNPPDA